MSAPVLSSSIGVIGLTPVKRTATAVPAAGSGVPIVEQTLWKVKV